MARLDPHEQTVKGQLSRDEAFIAGMTVLASAAEVQGARTEWIAYLGLTSYRLFVIQGGRVEALPLRSFDLGRSLSIGRDGFLRPTVVVAGTRFTFGWRDKRFADQIARALSAGGMGGR